MAQLKILNPSLEPLAILLNVVSPSVSEEINREFTASFQTIIDGDKSDYITYQNIVEIEGNYFNIVYTKDNHNPDGTLTIDGECEHVSYDLIGDENDPADPMIHEYYANVGTPTALLTTLLSGTGFTVGQVDFTALTTIAINEKVNKRGILITLAEQLGGELKFDKYEISLLSRRGADRGLGFRYRRNLASMSRITDNRNKVDGLPTVTYTTDVVELEFAEGHGTDDHYELGDTVYLFDDQLGIANVPLRIIKESHNPQQRMQGNVTISNLSDAFVKDIHDTVAGLQQSTVYKGALYNGVRISAYDGFVATRTDNKVRTTLNATNGISVQSGDGLGTWVDRFYVDIDGNTRLKNAFIDITSGDTYILISPTEGIRITKDSVDKFSLDTNGNVQLKDASINITSDGTNIIISPVEGIKITKDSVDKFYVDVNGNLTFDGKMMVTDSGNTLAEIFKDTNGGILNLYDLSGNLNVKIGVESGVAGNTGGTLVLFKDVPPGSDPINFRRVELGISSTFDCGAANFRDTSNKVRASIQADSSAGPYIGIRDSAEVMKSYISEFFGKIDNELIATRPWVDIQIAAYDLVIKEWVVEQIAAVIFTHIEEFHTP